MKRIIGFYAAALAASFTFGMIAGWHCAPAVAAGGIAVDAGRRWHEACGWHRAGGKAAARRRRRFQGWASMPELHRTRRAAARLTRRICPGAGLLLIGKTRLGQPAAVCRENSVLYVGPPGYGKTGALACHAADAPGALFATSTKTELLLDTIAGRAGRGRIWILNADGYGNIPNTLAWSPVDGCESATVAIRRAGDFTQAAPKGDGKGDGDYWAAKGAGLIAVMLHAAAIASGSMREVAAWVRDPWAQAVKEIYVLDAADPVLGHKLASLLSSAGEHLNSVIGAAEAALAWMDDPVMDAIACPRPGEGFSPREFARSHGSVYLIARKRPFGSVAPYSAALGAEVFEQLRAFALEHTPGRLPVPATYVLDEMPLTCPLPVHDMLADARGYLITIAAGIQSYSQLRSVWGRDDGDTIRSASPVEVIFGGEKRRDDLEALSAVIGDRDTWHHVRSSGGKTKQPGSERLMPPEALHRLAKGKAVILAPECRPVLAAIPAIWKRPGYQRADLSDAAFRSGRAAEGLPRALEAPDPEGAVTPAPAPPAMDEPGAVPALTAEEDEWPATVPAMR